MAMTPRHNGTITDIVLHHSATAAGVMLPIQEVHRWHLGRGWDGVGYHYLVQPDGTVESGRPEFWTGSHVARQNTGKIGVCVVGSGKPSTPDQEEAVVSLVLRLLQRYPDSEVKGHRDFMATECPGFDVAEWWDAVRTG